MPEQQLLQIAIEKLKPSPFNPRKDFAKEALAELAESIRTQGVQIPLVVRALSAAQFEIVAGERRFRAARLAELEDVPCLVRELTDEQARELQIVENLQREDLTAIEEAQGFQDLLKLANSQRPAQERTEKLGVKELAERVGKSKEYVYSRLKLISAAPAVKKQLAAGEITPGHAIEIARLPEKLQGQALKEAHDEYDGLMPVQELRRHIAEHYRLDLGKAPWPKDDAGLDSKAGPCTTCPKRAGNNPDLYAGLKPDTCTDPDCFRQKARWFVMLRHEKNPDMPLVAFPGEGASRDEVQKLPFTTLVDPYSYRTHGKCKSGELALIAAAHDATRIGATLTICRDAKCKTHHPLSRAGAGAGTTWSAAEKRKEKQRRAELDRRSRLFRAVVEKAGYPSADEERAALAWAIEQIDQDHAKRACEALGLPPVKTSYGGKDYQGALRKRAVSVDRVRLSSWLVYAAIAAEDLYYSSYLAGSPKTKLLDQAAKRLRVQAPPAPAKKPAKGALPTSAKPLSTAVRKATALRKSEANAGSSEKRRNAEKGKAAKRAKGKAKT